jgi:hypothetical protein
MSQGGWYWCNQCQGLFTLTAPASITTPVSVRREVSTTTPAAANTVSPRGPPGQPTWKWCNQCMGLFFSGNGLGVCPPVNAQKSGILYHWHNPLGSGNYHLNTSDSPEAIFRRCFRCGNLFLQYPPVSIHGVPVSFGGVCAAGGIHDDIDSASYDLSGSSEQSDWFPCAKCLCLFFAGSPGPDLGLCAAGGAHEKFDNGNPAFNYTLSGSRDQQPGWLWCNTCQCLFFGEPLNNPDACAAQTHNDTGSLDYYLETSRPAQSDWRWCSKCKGLFFAGSPGNNLGFCPAGGTHTVSDSGAAIRTSVRVNHGGPTKVRKVTEISLDPHALDRTLVRLIDRSA